MTKEQLNHRIDLLLFILEKVYIWSEAKNDEEFERLTNLLNGFKKFPEVSFHQLSESLTLIELEVMGKSKPE